MSPEIASIQPGSGEGFTQDPCPAVPEGSGQPDHSKPAVPEENAGGIGSPVRRLFGQLFLHALILTIALLFAVFYVNTFRGHRLYEWTHGPFNFESGVYQAYAQGRINILTTGDNKLSKHLLCAVLYPVFYRVLINLFPFRDGPLVCASLGGLTLLTFGIWAYRRGGKSLLAIALTLLLGFSFNTWYVSSVCESRAFIMFGAVVLLIAIDLLLRRPCAWSLVFAILASIFSILITMGNAYLLPLVPVSLLLRAGRLGIRKVIQWLVLYSLAVGLTIGGTYQVMGLKVNPQLKIANQVALSRHETKTIRAHPGRLNWTNYRNVGLQALVYSVGGLYLPCGDRMCDREWVNENAWRAYFHYPRGIFFAAGYAVLILTAFAVSILKNLWLREPILWIILLWGFLCITFFVYFNPWAGPVYTAELQLPFWAFILLTLSRLRSRKIAVLLLVFALVLFWNNFSVIRYFRYHYGGEQEKAEMSRSVFPVPPDPVFRPGGV